MLTIIATGMISFGMGLWMGEIRAAIGCNKRIDILKDILVENTIEKFYNDPKLVDKLVDRIKKA